MNQSVRTRFAPSPTGYMHVGGVRTALFAWLVARQARGQFILRIEDTDKAREVKGSEAHITQSLKWLGLNWDEGPDNAGPAGPYRQSERLDIYKEWGKKLVNEGLAYADSYTPQQLEELRQKAINEKRPFLFRDHRPENPPKWDGRQPLRLRSQPRSYAWHDEVLGDLKSGPEAIDDFILIKSDGYPTYNFAHIIDDYLMQISHVIRSQEFLASVPKFLNLYELLGFERPILATLPYVLRPDGKKKLSKRDGAKDILEYAREGYLPEALVGFLATLGWNDGTEQEIFKVDELVTKFSLARVQKSGAKFDDARLLWINGFMIRQMPLDELYAALNGYWPASAKKATESYKKAVLQLVQERLKYFAELATLTHFFFEKPDVRSELLVDKHTPNEMAKNFLTVARDSLATAKFNQEALEKVLRKKCGELDTKPGVFFSLIRRAVTGSNVAPGLFETLELLGKEVVIDRLSSSLEALAN